jgi:NADH:ubiquinone oxidoreductase subunit 6 (subunit J)
MTSPSFAADYPFLNVLWSMLIFIGFVMWIFLAISMFSDIFRRRDMGGFPKVLWILAVFFLPLVGVLAYLLIYHASIAERSRRDQEAAEAAFDQRVREAADASGPAGEIATARSLLDAGTIDQAEFEALKTRALAGHA